MGKKTVILLLVLFCTSGWAIDQNSLLPPIDAKFRPRVDFWKKVYTEIDSDQGFIHDKEDPSIIYRKVDFKTKNYRQKARASRNEVNKLKKIFYAIINKNLTNLNKEEKEILELSKATTRMEVKKAMNNLRTQYGLKDNYYIGLKRSHRYLDYIQSVFEKYGLPKELIYLPHVESSFNYRAYSKVGAAGIWQFMRSTARRFGMKINYVIDERRDPFIATIGAAKLLRYNHSVIGSWPLAITAYNHGLRSMEMAVKRVGSKSISEIIEKYDGKRFGFASKNFYATFIATVEISQDPQKYFPSFVMPPKFEYTKVVLPKPLSVKQIMQALNVDSDTIKFYNPSIRSIVYTSNLQLPKGFQLQLPPMNEADQQQKLATLDELQVKTHDMSVATVHKINRGDSLYTLSKIYRVSIHDLIVFNQISNPSRIYPGMKIKIPGRQELAALKQKSTPEVIPQTDNTAVAKVDIKPETENQEVVKTQDAQTEVEEKKITTTTTIPNKPQEKSWYQKIISWYQEKDEDPAAIVADVNEDKAAEKKSEIAAQLVNLDEYNLTINHLSGELYEITIETDETLGHYSDWSLTPIAEIKRANRMHQNSIIRIGQKLKLMLPAEKHERFISQRAEYHLSIQEDFFQNYSVNGTDDYTVKTGDSLSQILNRTEIPLWLFRKYQPKDFNHLQALVLGQQFKIPLIEKRTE